MVLDHHLHFQIELLVHAINPSTIVTPNESSIIGYNFYLPRKDKVLLDSQGIVSVLVGESNINPKAPDILIMLWNWDQLNYLHIFMILMMLLYYIG